MSDHEQSAEREAGETDRPQSADAVQQGGEPVVPVHPQPDTQAPEGGQADVDVTVNPPPAESGEQADGDAEPEQGKDL